MKVLSVYNVVKPVRRTGMGNPIMTEYSTEAGKMSEEKRRIKYRKCLTYW